MTGTFKVPALDHRLQRRKDLLVAPDRRWRRRRPARRNGRRRLIAPPCGFSWWPPNPKRIAESSLFGKSASPRELKRSYSAAVSTGAGTASSIAALIVQRPSPESETRPANFASAGSSSKRRGRQVEQPRGDHAAAPPDFGDVGQIEVVLVVLGIAQRRRLGVDRRASACRRWRLAGCHALGIRGHHPVLDAVVHHLDEMAGAVRAAMQVALLGRAAGLVAARRARECRRCPGASVAKIGSRCFTTSSSPPIIMQ